MKKLLLISLVLVSCTAKEYKYRVVGSVVKNNKKYNAVWFTNDLKFDNEYAYYYNSNKTKVIIYPPFTIDTLR
jgi:hypothetical protein